MINSDDCRLIKVDAARYLPPNVARGWGGVEGVEPFLFNIAHRPSEITSGCLAYFRAITG